MENDLFIELNDNMFDGLRTGILAMYIKKIVDEGKLADFLDFAREQAKKDGMDTDGLMGFLDSLEKQYLTDEGIDWNKTLDIVKKVTGCKVGGFKGDKCLIIENEELSDEDCIGYINDENVAKIDLEHINNALKVINVKLEFIDALLLPFDADGFQNICRFKVVKLD